MKLFHTKARKGLSSKTKKKFKRSSDRFFARKTVPKPKKKPLFSDDFERDHLGRIKGTYIDGKFIPD